MIKTEIQFIVNVKQFPFKNLKKRNIKQQITIFLFH